MNNNWWRYFKYSYWKNKKGRHILLAVIFALFCISYQLFFSSNSLSTILAQMSRKNALEKKLEEKLKTYKIDSAKLDELKDSNIGLERRAREQFYMHQRNEVVFIIPDSVIDTIQMDLKQNIKDE